MVGEPVEPIGGEVVVDKNPDGYGIGDIRLTPEAITKIAAKAEQAGKPGEATAYSERLRVVALCAVCGKPVIAEEVEAHADTHVSDLARPLVRAIRDAVSVEPAVLVELQALLTVLAAK